MQSLIDPLLGSCFQCIPQPIITTIYLNNNILYPVSDEAIHNENRLKEFLLFLTVNKQWNRVLKQFSKLCWNNCCYRILATSRFVSVEKFLQVYPYLAHIDFYGSDPFPNADYNLITMMDCRAANPFNNNFLTVMNSIKTTVKKMAYIVWYEGFLPFIWECTQLEWLDMGMEQDNKGTPMIDGIVSLQKLKHLTIACEYGVSKASFHLIGRLPLLESFFQNIGQYPDHNLIDYFPHLKCYDFRYETSAEETLEHITIPKSLEKVVVRCYGRIFPITKNLASQLKSFILNLTETYFTDEVLLQSLITNLENCNNLQQFQILKIEENYENYAQFVAATITESALVEAKINKFILECCYIDGYFRPGGRQHLIERLKNCKLYGLRYGE